MKRRLLIAKTVVALLGLTIIGCGGSSRLDTGAALTRLATERAAWEQRTPQPYKLTVYQIRGMSDGYWKIRFTVDSSGTVTGQELLESDPALSEDKIIAAAENYGTVERLFDFFTIHANNLKDSDDAVLKLDFDPELHTPLSYSWELINPQTTIDPGYLIRAEPPEFLNE